jgi:hypothetical protein
MWLLKHETSILQPAVNPFDASVDNALGCACIFMEQNQALPLQPVWFRKRGAASKGASRAPVEGAVWLCVLREVVQTLTELSRFTFDKGHALLLNDATADVGNGGVGSAKPVTGIGLMKTVDRQAMLKDAQNGAKAAMTNVI